MQRPRLAAAVIAATAFAVPIAPAAAATEQPVAAVRIGQSATVNRDGSASVIVVYRLPYRDPRLGRTHATIVLNLAQPGVDGRKKVGHLRADGRAHVVRITVDARGRRDFRQGRAAAQADLNTVRRTLDIDRRWVWLRRS